MAFSFPPLRSSVCIYLHPSRQGYGNAWICGCGCGAITAGFAGGILFVFCWSSVPPHWLLVQPLASFPSTAEASAVLLRRPLKPHWDGYGSGFALPECKDNPPLQPSAANPVIVASA